MSRRGLYDRSGELLGYLEGTRVYNAQGDRIGDRVGQVIVDQDGERRWLIDRDALLNLHRQVIGYLGEQVPPLYDEQD